MLLDWNKLASFLSLSWRKFRWYKQIILIVGMPSNPFIYFKIVTMKIEFETELLDLMQAFTMFVSYSCSFLIPSTLCIDYSWRPFSDTFSFFLNTNRRSIRVILYISDLLSLQMKDRFSNMFRRDCVCARMYVCLQHILYRSHH